MFLKKSWKGFWSGIAGMFGRIRMRLFPCNVRDELREVRRLLKRIGFADCDLFSACEGDCVECQFSYGDGIRLAVGDRWDEPGRISLTMLTDSRRRSPVSGDFLRFTHFSDNLRNGEEEVRKALMKMVSEALDEDCRHGVRDGLEAMRKKLEEAR